ncbi:MAG: cobaltochelatase subunit CobN, partial [Hyphomicrobium sp.]
MHIVVRESRDLDEAAVPQDLGLAPADIVFLSFSDSDLAMAAAAFRGFSGERPSLRIANLNALRHPMSVDLFADTTLKGTKAVLVRLLGGLDYWRYGGEQLGRRCRELGIALAMVPGDGRPDVRLSALSTLAQDDLVGLEALLDAGGVENTRVALQAMIGARGAMGEIPSARPIPNFGVYRESAIADARGKAAVVFYRSHLLAGDVAPVDALTDALEERGMATSALYVPSLKAADAAAWMKDVLGRERPDVIINATAFAARDGADGSPFEVADCPVLQVALANSNVS